MIFGPFIQNTSAILPPVAPASSFVQYSSHELGSNVTFTSGYCSLNFSMHFSKYGCWAVSQNAYLISPEISSFPSVFSFSLDDPHPAMLPSAITQLSPNAPAFFNFILSPSFIW